MHRISRRDLEIWFSVAIKMMPKSIVWGLKSKLPLDSDAASTAMAERLAAIVDNDSRMVIATEFVAQRSNSDGISSGGLPGKWGVDEPGPCE